MLKAVLHGLERKGLFVAGSRVNAGYSPDFNPIERAWSKLKALLRKAGVRTLRKLRNALRWALLEITSDDALGWISHCGFRVPCH